ncbi:hypothetical protein HK405_003763, partial [Cladochytrium tenue]
SDIFPQVVVDAIVQQLGRAGAARAARVSRSWAAAARPVVFAKVCLSGPSPYPTTHESNQQSTTIDKYDDPDDGDLMLEPHKKDDVLARLDCAGSPLTWVKELRFYRVSPKEAAGFARMLQRAGARPTRLDLTDMEVTEEVSAAFEPIAGLDAPPPHAALRYALNLAGRADFGRLRRLYIEAYEAVSEEDLEEIAKLCPNLEALDMRVCLETVAPLYKCTQLRHLNFATPLGLFPNVIAEVKDLILRPQITEPDVQPISMRAVLCDTVRFRPYEEIQVPRPTMLSYIGISPATPVLPKHAIMLFKDPNLNSFKNLKVKVPVNTNFEDFRKIVAKEIGCKERDINSTDF